MSGKSISVAHRSPGVDAPKSARLAMPPLFNYSNDAGRGSQTFVESPGATWRRALLGGVAAGAIWAGAPRSAAASAPVCGSSSTYDFATQTLTCVQDQHDGISTSVPNLIVKTLTGDIEPVFGRGITMFAYGLSGVATLTSDLGQHKIATSGNGDAGIAVHANSGLTIIHSGDIVTNGDFAAGIEAGINFSDDERSALALKLGGPSAISITSVANITTAGARSSAISATTDFSAITINSTGDLTAAGLRSNGIEVYSRTGTIDISSVGNITAGDLGAGIYVRSIDSGRVAITSKGSISAGNSANGILANASGDVAITSIGAIKGGSGSSGIAVTSRFGNISVASKGDITLSGSNGVDEDSANAGIYISGQGDISVASTGNINVSGSGRDGIYALSNYRYFESCGDGEPCTDAKLASVAVPVPGVTITSTGDITTKGDFASAIYANAISAAISITSKGNLSASGYDSFGIDAYSFGGNISIASKGTITTNGSRADGIYANTQYGNVSITQTGDITATGLDAAGIFAHGTYAVDVTVQSGTIKGGAGADAGAGVVFDGPGTGTLTNHGQIIATGDGSAILGKQGSETVNNFGTVTGNVDLDRADGKFRAASGTNVFNNAAGATFNSGTIANLGNGGTLTNNGLLSPGGNGTIETTDLTGKLVQGATGALAIDIDHTRGTADRINIAGGATDAPITRPAAPSGSAALAGKVLPNLTSFDIATVTKSFTIVSAAGGTEQAGLKVADTALVDYSLLYPNDTDAVLKMQVTFSVNGLTPNQSSVVGYFGRGIGAGKPQDLETIYLALLNAPDAAGVAAIADQLYSNAAGGAAVGSIQSGEALALALRSCPVAEGPYGQLRETSCVWAKPLVREFRQDRNTDKAKIDSGTTGISGGFQTTLGHNLWGGLGVSFEDINSVVNDTTRADSTWWQIGGVMKWTNGPWKLSGSISGGQGNIDSGRSITIPGLSAIASTDADIGSVTGLARLAYTFGATSLYVTPMVDVGFNYIDLDGFTETGAGALNLAVTSANEFIFSGGPAVEIGTTLRADGLTIRPYIKAGVTFLSDDGFTTTARFAGAPASVAPFAVNSKFDDVFADINAGVQLFSSDGINLRFNYEGRFGEESEQHGVDAKLTVNY